MDICSSPYSVDRRYHKAGYRLRAEILGDSWWLPTPRPVPVSPVETHPISFEDLRDETKRAVDEALLASQDSASGDSLRDFSRSPREHLEISRGAYSERLRTRAKRGLGTISTSEICASISVLPLRPFQGGNATTRASERQGRYFPDIFHLLPCSIG